MAQNHPVYEVLAEIERRNAVVTENAIPHSDEMLKYLENTVGIPKDTARESIRMLIDAHRILVFEIVAEDKKHSIPRIEAYVVADLPIVRSLLSFFKTELENQYERQFHKHLMVHQLIKEIFPMMKSLNNTQVGQTANKTIMLMEFERLLERNYGEYSRDWQNSHLAELIGMKELSARKAQEAIIAKKLAEDVAVINRDVESASQGNFIRATDTTTYRDFIEKGQSYPLQRVLNIYGVEFFFKVNLRKNQFLLLKKVIDDGQISKRADLLLLRDMITLLKERFASNPDLSAHRDDVYQLEHSVNRAVYFNDYRKK